MIQTDHPAVQPSLIEWKKDVLALAGLLFLVIAFFFPILIGNAFLWTDFIERIYPMRLFAAVELHAGRLPYWNPYMFGGIPFFAMIDNAVLYPLNWVFVPLVRNNMLSFLIVEWHTIAHVALLGVGTYYFCRYLDISRTGAFTAAVAWMLSGTIVHRVFHGEMLHTIVWLPFILILLGRAFDRMSFRAAIAAGGVWSLAILAGHPQIFMYIAYTLGLYYLMRLIVRVRTSSHRRSDALRMTGIFAIMMAVGLGISAAVFLPAYELAGFSQRGEMTGRNLLADYALNPRQLITFFMPDFFGRMSATQWDYWVQEAYGHYWETYAYMGILPLMLAGLAVCVVRKPFVIFSGVLSVLCLLMMLGDATPVLRIVSAVAPGFDQLRAHARLSILLAFAVAVLAGYGLDALRQSEHNREIRKKIRFILYVTGGIVLIGILSYFVVGDILIGWLAGGVEYETQTRTAIENHTDRCLILILLSCSLLAGWGRLRRRTGILTAATTSLIVADLFSAGVTFNLSPQGPDQIFPYDDLVRAVQQQQRQEGGRISFRAGSYGLMKRNAGTVFRIFTLEGYASPLRLAHTTPPTDGDRLFDLMNVKYYIRMEPDGRTARLAANPDAMGWAFIARRYVVAEDMVAVRSAMAAPSFDHRTTVTLDAPPHIDIPPDTAMATEQPVVRHYEPDRMALTVDMTRPGLLVVSEVYYPAWRAYVDGREERVFRANGTLRAVALPSGLHTVEFRYESTSVRIGTVISLGTLFLVAVTGISAWRSRNQNQYTDGKTT